MGAVGYSRLICKRGHYKTGYHCTSCTKMSSRYGDLRRLYGITPDQYDQMFQDQKVCCAICDKHQTELKFTLGVDHDHKTGELRSLLCRNCNLVIGWTGEDIDKLKRMVQYLEGD